MNGVDGGATGVPDDGQAQYQRGVEALNRQQFPTAERCLRQAVEAGSTNAKNALAAMYLYGMGVAINVPRAVELYTAATEAGHADAAFTLANLYFIGVGVEQDEERARTVLAQAASGGSPGALRVLGFVHARLPGGEERQRLAAACFLAAARAGDPLAMHVIGSRYVVGDGVERDDARGRFWLQAAATAGIALSARRLARLPDVESAAPPEDEEPDTAAAVNFRWPVNGFEAPHAVSEDPRISFIDRVLSAEECDYLIMLAEPRLAASLTLDPATGKMLASKLRTSRSMNFLPATKDIVLHLVERRLAALADMPADHSEPLAVLHYRKNEEYKPHYDYFIAEAMAREPRLKVSGQRLVTTFVYLCDVTRGGGTDFPRLMKTVEPKQGRALLMHNCDPSGRPDPRTLHAGLPVVDGEKWLVTLWFRERPFTQA